MNRIAFLGLGRMGTPMAQRLIDAGHSLTVWSRTRAHAEALVARGARVADSPADAVHDAKIVVLMLADPRAVESVLGGAHGVTTAPLGDALVIDCSTVGPGHARRFAELVRHAGGRFVDAPVLGSTPAATAGTLTVLASGEGAALDAAEPILSRFGRVVRAGEVGQGNALKLVMNLLVGGLTEVLAEALVLGERSGLSPTLVRETIFASVLKSPFLEYKAPQLFEKRYAPLFGASLMLKDMDLILAQARGVGASLPAAAVMRELYGETVAESAAQGEERDFAAVIEAVRARGRR